MIKNIIFSVSIILSFLVALPAHSASSIDEEELVYQFRMIELQIKQLTSIQTQEICISKLENSAIAVHIATKKISDKKSCCAKRYIKKSIRYLNGAQIEHCADLSTIDIMKNGLEQIYNQLN
jgi:hypothetical protein